MSKKVKNLISDELRQEYAGVDSVMIVNPIGLDAISSNQLRGRLKAKKIELRVVKNSLARRAFGDGPLSSLMERLDGCNAIVSGGESIVDVAKELAELRKQFAKLQIKGAIVEGELFDEGHVGQLATMPGKKELQGTVVMLALSPASRLAGALIGPARRIAGGVAAIVEKYEKDQAPGGEPAQG